MATTEIPTKFRQWVVKSSPGTTVVLEDVFELKEISIADEPKEGKILVKCQYFSHDPAQRGWITYNPDADPARLYMPTIMPGQLMKGTVIGEVVASWTSDFAVGDVVYGNLGWTEYALVDPVQAAASGLGPVKVPQGISPADAMAATATAWTAYFGLWRVGELTGKESTIVVSTAAGATGSFVCQFAKYILGIKNVIGITGSDEKCEFIKAQCGVDIALNYKSPTFEEDFAKATPAPGYIDVYWDNVGSKMLDMALTRMAKFGKIIACGAISGYGQPAEEPCGVSRGAMNEFFRQSLTMRGFIVLNFKDEFGEAYMKILGWIKEGKIKAHSHVVEHAFGDVPKGMLMLINSENTGKLISKVA